MISNIHQHDKTNKNPFWGKLGDVYFKVTVLQPATRGQSSCISVKFGKLLCLLSLF